MIDLGLDWMVVHGIVFGVVEMLLTDLCVWTGMYDGPYFFFFSFGDVSIGASELIFFLCLLAYLLACFVTLIHRGRSLLDLDSLNVWLIHLDPHRDICMMNRRLHYIRVYVG